MEVKNSGNKSHHVRLHITRNGLKTGGRNVSPTELHRVLAWALMVLDVSEL